MLLGLDMDTRASPGPEDRRRWRHRAGEALPGKAAMAVDRRNDPYHSNNHEAPSVPAGSSILIPETFFLPTLMGSAFRVN